MERCTTWIDDINPLVSVTADYGIIAEDRPRNQFTYGVLEVPDGNGGFVESDRGPIGTYLYNLVATPPDLVSLIGPYGKGNDSTPTFEWDFLVPDEQITEVNLFVSTFAKGEGLLPTDELVDLSDSSFLPQFTQGEKRELLTKRWNGYDDFNPGRILTATWKKETNTWYDRDGTEIIAGDDDPRNTSTRLTLNDVLTLTAGQDYNWAVQAVRANGETDIDFDSFRTTSGLTDNPFSSVSILTHGFTILPTATGVPNDFFELADSIASVNGEAPDEKGLILLYDKPTGLWTPVDGKGKKINELTDNLNPGDENYLTILADNIIRKYVNQNKSLVLLPEWSTLNESIIETK
ncbi:hypothetical protein IQ247_06225 [Plectonema cf. radiosum LEGE 06105]|uniref:Uncharacterized protein n=1 Tax=Plectonema cf. radiosum LEGE 06105 TaxID=945769 RepID=A0A8J7K1U8_9CYAN|nr:hypothetical protein [Plectonema radiosum]MBE9212307.1 hypothetical protein [Plectonema cf. radiosum LEGE 06105]